MSHSNKQNKRNGGTTVAVKPSTVAAKPSTVVERHVSTVRTPWGEFEPTPRDAAARDPMEPDAPVSADFRRESGPAPLSPRELFEMLMAPAVEPKRKAADPTPEPHVPAQADLVLSALEAGQADQAADNRRKQTRRAYRVRAVLRLFSDSPQTAPWVLFTRDVHSRGLGFITQQKLPLGYGGTIELPDPAGGETPLRIPCTLLRCREAAPGWYEGSLYFNRPQPGLVE